MHQSSQGQQGLNLACPTISLKHVKLATGLIGSCLVVLWAPGLKHSGWNNKGGSWHFVSSGSFNLAASNPLPGFCLGWHRKLETKADSDCWATDLLQRKWFSPAKRTPTHCHFKVTTSAPLNGSNKLASNKSFGCSTLTELYDYCLCYVYEAITTAKQFSNFWTDIFYSDVCTDDLRF